MNKIENHSSYSAYRGRMSWARKEKTQQQFWQNSFSINFFRSIFLLNNYLRRSTVVHVNTLTAPRLRKYCERRERDEESIFILQCQPVPTAPKAYVKGAKAEKIIDFICLQNIQYSCKRQCYWMLYTSVRCTLYVGTCQQIWWQHNNWVRAHTSESCGE